ncbi:MAG: cupin domain-containing protein [bacterium]|nr:cupin domain-containing protein [bacterium]
MSIEHTLASQHSLVLASDEGQHLEFLNNLATIRVAAGGERSMSVVEFLAPRGFGPPEHRHNDEDELFIVLDGELAFLTGGERIPGGEGSLAYLPHGVPHTFQVLSDSARIVNVTASNSAVPRFDEMVSALGEPTQQLTIPEPGYIDPARVAEVCAAHGIDIVGPPPAPLA